MATVDMEAMAEAGEEVVTAEEEEAATEVAVATVVAAVAVGTKYLIATAPLHISCSSGRP